MKPRDDYQAIRGYLDNPWSCVEGALEKVPELKTVWQMGELMSGAKGNEKLWY